jgi:gliding motility-associated-like protein
VKGVFSWTPSCSQIQLLPYQVTFKVTDNKGKDPLINFESVFIRVVAPAVTGLTATPNGTNMELKWNEAFCNNTSGNSRLRGYDIYRKDSCGTWVHAPCETGVPSYTGYKLIGSTDYTIRNFTDNNNGLGLIHGVNYSYIVVAHYIDESESYASVEACAQLVRDVPIITNVSVLQTDAANGKIWIHWAKPLGIAPNLDTINNPPPYKYVLQQSPGFAGTTFTEISSYTYASYSQLTDTGFVSTALNTQDTAYSYRVDFYSDGRLKGSTHVASSVFLRTISSDNTITLNWQMKVPWTNYLYYISKETPTGSGNYKLIDSTTATTYSDKILINNVLYCYKITSAGAYADTSLIKPLLNHSQVKCDRPGDHTPPCQPALTLDTKCDVESNVLTWLNPNTYCSDDALSYNIYYSPNNTDPLKLIGTITDINQTTFPYADDFYGVRSIAGCYAVTAVDSFNNESPIVKTSCVDNCPYYGLPNVFTPNGDNQNDLFTPLPHYRFVKDIEIKIYDRWGLLMFETKDINILWNGTNSKNKLPCPSGTYYYVCTVNEIRLAGIVPRVLRGFIELLQEEAKPQK